MYKIADLHIEMECSGETLLVQGKPYRTGTSGRPDMTISIRDEKLRQMKEGYPQFSFDEWEYIHKGFAFSYRLLEHSGFCLHASAVAVDRKAVLFSGICGTGKSTHAGLWREYFGNRAVILNDDRPALRLSEDEFYVYGTPWSGKTNRNTNRKAPLQAVVFLEQAKENHMERLDNKEAIKLLIRHSIRPNHDNGGMDSLLTLLDALLQKAPVYQMGCNISMDAVKLAYDTINERMERP